MLNIAKYCVRYLWDHNWSPIHSPTFTVEFFSLFHLIPITNLIASTAQFINKSRASSCEDTRGRKSTLHRKRITLTFPSPGAFTLVRKAGLHAGTVPAGMLCSAFRALLPRGRWVSPHPPAPSGCSAEDFHPDKLILSGWFSQLGSWMRLSPSHITKATKVLKDIGHLFWYEFL